ncbi:MAG TPA: hypothetical protein PKZ23_08465, partial [Rectinema sp.]|nr:hypothetical protein [Rectinema sp.]
MSYAEFDALIIHKILPLVAELEKCRALKLNPNLWRYKSLHCDVDPISELVERANNSWQKIALLKELGRAAYENPLKIIDEPESKSASRLISLGAMQNRQFSK